MRSLDLFTGYGGLTLALEPWCQPIAYVEIEEYAQKIIASRMADGSLPPAPILADVKNIQGRPGDCDIIVGGFPCQDISVAGNGKGLAGERSGLFFEVCRLVEEIQPSFVFLENVPAIRTRGLSQVIDSLTALRYDCRWTCVSAAEVGAPHLRKRWFLLAHTKQSDGRRGAFVGISDKQRRHTSKTWPKSIQPENSEESSGATELLCPVVAHANSSRPPDEQIRKTGQLENSSRKEEGIWHKSAICTTTRSSDVAHASIKGLEVRQQGNAGEQSSVVGRDWWSTEPDVGRVAHGVTFRVDRIKALGNGVVPQQARAAFARLLFGLT
jgi:DNA (cytosine-5)-methyltransferase 1